MILGGRTNGDTQTSTPNAEATGKTERTIKGDEFMILFLHPIYALYSWHFLKMLGVVRDDSQTIMSRCNTNHNIKVAYNNSLAGVSAICLSTPPR